MIQAAAARTGTTTAGMWRKGVALLVGALAEGGEAQGDMCCCCCGGCKVNNAEEGDCRERTVRCTPLSGCAVAAAPPLVLCVPARTK